VDGVSPGATGLRVNWGSAFDQFEGWWASDIDDHGQDHVGDILDGLPLADGSVEILVANHALQMLAYTDVRSTLAEFVRVVAPGGVVRVIVGDIFGAAGAVAAYRRGDPGWFPIVDEAEPTLGGKLSAYSTWYSAARTLFTAGWLQNLLEEHGCEAAVAEHGFSFFSAASTELDTRPSESIFVEGRKR